MKSTLVISLLFLFSITALSPAFADSAKKNANDHRRPEYRDKGSNKQKFHSHKRQNHYVPGRRIERLPARNHHFNHRGKEYYYFGGSYFHRYPNHYVSVRAPIGARVPYLSPGYVSFHMGTRRYYYAGFTYYLWDDRHRDYVVVAEPNGAQQAVVSEASNSGEIYAYPAKGQSAEQQDRDYYDCHVWAVDESDYDPSMESQDAGRASDYRRAMTACLEGRGYSVK